MSSLCSQNIEANINKNLHVFEKDSTIASFYATKVLSKDNFDTNKVYIIKLLMFFGLPFVLLGKGASYFLVLGVGEYFSIKGYIFMVIGFILMMVILVALFPAFTIAMRLQYKNDGK